MGLSGSSGSTSNEISGGNSTPAFARLSRSEPSALLKRSVIAAGGPSIRATRVLTSAFVLLLRLDVTSSTSATFESKLWQIRWKRMLGSFARSAARCAFLETRSAAKEITKVAILRAKDDRSMVYSTGPSSTAHHSSSLAWDGIDIRQRGGSCDEEEHTMKQCPARAGLAHCFPGLRQK